MQPIDYDKYIEYIKNTGGKPEVGWFDEDWEPIGPLVRNDMERAGIISIKNGHIYLNN